MTRTREATIVFAALVAAAAFPSAARAQCYLENVASLQEIASGWTIHEDRRIVKQEDSAPYERDGAGTGLSTAKRRRFQYAACLTTSGVIASGGTCCSPVVTKSQVQICQATADGGSVPFVPADAKPRPADTAYEVYQPY